MNSTIPTPSLQVPPTPHSRPFVSLSTLPLELKSLVVDKIAEIGNLGDELDSEADVMETDATDFLNRSDKAGDVTDERLRRTPLRAISLISRVFAALAEPYLWGSVDLNSFNSRVTSYLLAEVLPRHGRHIKSLTVCSINVCRETGIPLDDATLSQKLLSLAKAIDCMPNLSTVYCSTSHLSNASFLSSRTASASVRARVQVATSLAALGGRLTDFSIFDDGAGVSPTLDQLASFLSHFTSLSHLSLRVGALGGCLLLSTIFSMRHLKHLVIHGALFTYYDTFAAATPTCPLETLRLTHFLSSPSFFRLLSNFSATLRTLKLQSYLDDGESHVDPTNHVSRTPFPHLHTRDISANQTPEFFASFSFCPLQYLTIEEGPGIDFPPCLAFVESHAATLKRVKVLRLWPAHPSPRLRRLCRTKGIELDADTSYDE